MQDPSDPDPEFFHGNIESAQEKSNAVATGEETHTMSEQEYMAIMEAVEDLGAINNDCHEKIKLLKMILMSQGEICSLIV